MRNIFDSHAHYDDSQFDGDREELLGHILPEKGVSGVINMAADLKSCQTTWELTQRYGYVYGAAGIHPEEARDLPHDWLEQVRAWLGRPKMVAVGEIGLDYHWDEPEREVQRRWFSRQLELAREVKLPVIIHSRDAAKDTLDIMKAARSEEIGGVIHCFSYGVELAREYLDMGFYIGIGGVLTFTNGKKLKEVAAFAPLDRIVLETDCPYLAPVPNRGKRNSSLNLPWVVKALAQIKGVTEEEIEKRTGENARRLYRIQEGQE